MLSKVNVVEPLPRDRWSSALASLATSSNPNNNNNNNTVSNQQHFQVTTTSFAGGQNSHTNGVICPVK